MPISREELPAVVFDTTDRAILNEEVKIHAASRSELGTRSKPDYRGRS